jgi:hypothetical protein
LEVLPLHFERDMLPCVDVSIGSQPVRLHIDLGANQVTVAIKPSVLKRLAVQPLARQGTSMDAMGRVYRENYFIIPSLVLGRLVLTGLTGQEEVRLNASGQGAPGEGIIGNEVLNRFHVLLDYPAGRMELYARQAYPADLGLDHWAKIPFIVKKGIGILLRGKLGADGKTLLFCLDTGCGFRAGKESLGLIKPGVLPAQASSRLEQGRMLTMATPHFYLESTDLGPMKFLVYPFQQPPVDGILGHSLFARNRVFIDFERSLLFLERSPASGPEVGPLAAGE